MKVSSKLIVADVTVCRIVAESVFLCIREKKQVISRRLHGWPANDSEVEELEGVQVKFQTTDLLFITLTTGRTTTAIVTS